MTLQKTKRIVIQTHNLLLVLPRTAAIPGKMHLSPVRQVFYLVLLEYKYAQFLCSQCNVTELLALLVMCVTKPLKWMTEAYNHLWSGTCHFYCLSYIIVSPVHVAKCLAPVYLG